MAARQLVLDLGRPPSWRADDFLVSAANRAAAGWLDRWPAWPAPALVLHGPAGCGKTHLAQSFAARVGGHILDAGGLAGCDPEALAAAAALVIVEDADRQPGPLATAAGEQALCHLYNSLAAAGHWLLVTGRRPVRAWPLRLADLRSRLLAAPSVAIEAADDGLLAALMVKLFADRQLRVEAEVVDYLLPRVERSFAAVQALVARLDAAALAARRPITVPLARAVIAGDDGAAAAPGED